MTTRLEPGLRAAIPVLTVVFLVVCAWSGYALVASARDDLVADALADLEALAERVELRLRADQTAAAGEPAVALAATLAAVSGLTKGRRILVSRHSGETLHEAPATGAPPPTPAALLGGAHAAALSAGQPGAVTVTLADGTAFFAAARNLPAPLGQVIALQPVEAALGQWRSAARSHTSLLVTSGGVLLVLAVFFQLQGRRSREREAECLRLYERIDTALRTGRCGLWDWDIARGRIYWSHSMYDMLGLAARDGHLSIGDLAALVHPDDVDLLRLAEALARGVVDEIDHVFRARNGASDWLWLRARARVMTDPETGEAHLVGIAVDVTEHRHLAEATKAADRRILDAIEALPSAFVLWDRDNRLVLSNTLYRSLLGLSAADAPVGATYRDVMAAARTPQIDSHIELAREPQAEATGFETLLGDGRWLQVSERRTGDGGYVSVGTEITAVKSHQEDLVRSERRLLATVADLRRSRHALEYQAQQLADLAERYAEQKAEADSANRAKAEFLANMSHELRTPLNAIIGFAEMMEQGMFGQLGSARYVGYCQDIRKSGQYLLGFFDDVLDMARIESGRVTIDRGEVSVDETIGDAIGRVREAVAAKGLTLEIEPRAGLCFNVDAKAMRQVLVNLLQNAVKFTPPGGRVAVRTRAVAGAVNIYVEDTGIGIPRHALAKVGRPFEQVESQFNKTYKGSGLGLAIARSLTELHGGSMRIRSTVGTGTIVMVHVPIDGLRRAAPVAAEGAVTVH